MSFEDKLQNGEFCIPECSECKNIVWPPSGICNNCFGNVLLKKGEFEGKIIEFSRENENYFCMVEFEKTIRIMAHSLQVPKVGQTVLISNCGIKNGNYFFEII
ncbi:MAG: hypothetical protein ACQ9CV_04660 [Nitrosopumilus sp.]|jgi:uncharacterized OB-fold protein